MADVDEIIDYIKSLKKGFDKDLFQFKVDELANAVERTGLEYDDFHTLFKVWLNLSIPITKWTTLGTCMIPPEKIEEKTVEYSFRWILANYEDQTSFSRISFLLDWLTAAMDCECIDMAALDSGYELFYVMLTIEVLTVHAMKLVYTLTKPKDVTRRRVLELFDYAKKREAKKNLYRQLQVLLGLFKSYRPECVPEEVPAISIHTAFKKIKTTLVARFKAIQERRHRSITDKNHLMWLNPVNSERTNKKIEPLIPNMEFLNVGSKQYADKEPTKTYLDFSDPVSLLQYSLQHTMSRPARLRAMLCNETGLTLLAAASDVDHAFLSHVLHQLLTSCFLDGSPHSYIEKQDLLRRLVVLQRTLMQGLPIISRFLAQFLPHWNEKDYFAEILDLVEWIHADNKDQIEYILEPLTRIYHRSQPLEQCAILNSLTNMYVNLVYSSTKPQRHFMSIKTYESVYMAILPAVASTINNMCNLALQINPEDMRLLFSCASGAERMASAEKRLGARLGGVPRALPLALWLLCGAALADKAAALMMLYKKIFIQMKAANKIIKNDTYMEQIHTLKSYTCDLISCLYNEDALRSRKNGIVFDKLHPQLVGKLYSLMPDVDSKLSIRNHIGFAPYTFLRLEAIDHTDADNKLWFDTVIDQEFPNLSNFLLKTVPALDALIIGTVRRRRRSQTSTLGSLFPSEHGLACTEPINVPTVVAQAFPMDLIGRLGLEPPRGPSADLLVLTTADEAFRSTEELKTSFWSPIQNTVVKNLLL
ncbi:unnamed protein product [Chilo suppressalis]|uniref:Centromere protein I n=1 Tax=Chilo suppressalis TaxID=168631 RepID=A0ABN8B6I9_CHISP|nr:unnamed protein product [Chilo suppressalis]